MSRTLRREGSTRRISARPADETRSGAGDPAQNPRPAREIAGAIGLAADFNASAGELSIANQQLIEIVRGLLRNVRVLILDEPTSPLTRREAASLAQQMRGLTARGIGILFISHRLNEVIALGARVSVLRDGHFGLEDAGSTLTTQTLVEAMLPANLSALAERETTAATDQATNRSSRGAGCRAACVARSVSRSTPARCSGSRASSAPDGPSWRRRSSGSTPMRPARW